MWYGIYTLCTCKRKEELTYIMSPISLKQIISPIPPKCVNVYNLVRPFDDV